MIEVRRAGHEDAEWMQSSFDQFMGWEKPAGYFAECCQRQDEDKLVLFVAADDEKYVGHVKVVWIPGYPYYRENGIPEIQDLNVLPSHRRRGVATQLVDAAEDVIRPRSKVAGIGFGLYADYGPAQRMYFKRGYIPDGRGIMYHDKPVPPGSQVTVDDDLIMFLTKAL